MGDRKNILDRYGIEDMHFIFSVERGKEVDEVISAFESGKSLKNAVRRIKD